MDFAGVRCNDWELANLNIQFCMADVQSIGGYKILSVLPNKLG